MTCVECKWFDGDHRRLKEVENSVCFGYCRKHKPFLVKAPGGIYYGGWPLVDKFDYCGEFRAKDK